MIQYIEGSSFVILLVPAFISYFRKQTSKKKMLTSLKYAFILLPFMQGAALINNYTYLLTSISSSVIISESTMVFVFIISLFVWKHSFRVNKLIAILLALEGVIIITLTDESDSGGEKESLVGDLLALFNSFIYACYGVLIYYLIPPEIEKEFSFLTILGFIGLLMLTCFWVFVLIAHFTGLETIEAPPPEVVIYLTLDILFGVFGYEYFFC